MTGAISLENKADKKAERGGERGVINQMCFCIIGDLCFFMRCFKWQRRKQTGPEGNYYLLSLSLDVCIWGQLFVCVTLHKWVLLHWINTLLYTIFTHKCKVHCLLHICPHAVTKQPSVALCFLMLIGHPGVIYWHPRSLICPRLLMIPELVFMNPAAAK